MIGLKLNYALTKEQSCESKFQHWANTHEGKNYRYLRDRRATPLGVERATSEDGVVNTVSVIPG